MKKLMNMLMMSCKKATELIDKKIHSGISRQERMRLHMHTMMCNACRNYEKQGKLIDGVMKKSAHEQGLVNHKQHDHPQDLIDRVIHHIEKI